MGAFQVNESGDFASWLNPSRGLNGVGNIAGSMDLAVGVRSSTSRNGTNDKRRDAPQQREKKLMVAHDLKEIEL